jgi:hypothetical protein
LLPLAYATPAAIVLTLGGLITCFAGYRLFRVVLGFFGFIAGVMIGTSLVGAGSTWTMIMAAVVGGVAGALLMIAAYFVGVGLVGAGLAVLGLHAIWAAFASVEEPPTVVTVVVAVLGALVALSIVRYVAIFGTAIAGAWTFLIGGLALMGDPRALAAASSSEAWIFYPVQPGRSDWWVWAVWVGLSLAGAIVQLSTTTRVATRRPKKAAT